MSVQKSEVRIRGKSSLVPTAQIDDREVVVIGRWLRVAKIKDEDWIDVEPIKDPGHFVQAMRSRGLRADILEFSGGLDSEPNSGLGIFCRQDNAAVIKTDNFKAWWENLPQEARKNTRRAAKKGITISSSAFNDELVKGIKRIYDESPVRQGRPFWHYGKDLGAIKLENGTYLERSEFLAAHYSDQLVGFMKLVYVGNVARIMQIICLSAHQDKRPIIALITKAAEICHENKMRYLVYAKFTYGRKTDSSIAEFKRRLGFEQKDFARYYVPLTWRGRVALSLNAHAGWLEFLPPSVISLVTRLRSWIILRGASENAANGKGDDSELGCSANHRATTAKKSG